MTSFRYFADPRRYAQFIADSSKCSFCDEVAPVFSLDGVALDDDDDARTAFICEECLADGAAADEGIALNFGDMEELRAQLQAQTPNASAEQIAALVESRFAELAERTPRPKAGTGFLWPVHCSDFCRFEEEHATGDSPSLGVAAPAVLVFRCLHCSHAIEVRLEGGAKQKRD